MVWTTRTIGLTLAGVALVGGLAYVAFREDPVPVDLVDVVRAPLSVTIDADGQTRIRNLYEVASPIAGTARRAPVAVGDSVVSGQTVVAMVEPVSPALLDARSRAQAEASVAEAEAALDVARSDLRRAEEEEAFARLQFDRTQTLMTRGVATVTQMETVAQGLAVAEAAVAARSRAWRCPKARWNGRRRRWPGPRATRPVPKIAASSCARRATGWSCPSPRSRSIRCRRARRS
jgi:HlyD family secretion protein